MAVNTEDIVINTGSVYLVDPNKVNVNQNMVNAIPQYQDMHIFAELWAERRGRTVLVTGAQNGAESNNNVDKTIHINFLGPNQDAASPNNLNFTTNWYDGSLIGNTQYEGFGISNIKITVNSSYIPQVNIQFIDLRGLAFFNQTESPYRMIFDFPPPIFYLTIKGYYGMSLRYRLHLVKYTTEFVSSNGNFVIDAQFVAVTYAPLTDILFRYIVNFPLMKETYSLNPSSIDAPKNTYELIMKLKNLYSEESDKMNSDAQTQAYENIVTQLNRIGETINALNQYKLENTVLTKNGKPVLLVKNNNYANIGGQELKIINSTGEYDSIIKEQSTNGIPNDMSQRLYIAYLVAQNINVGEIGQANTQMRNQLVAEALKPYRKQLLSDANANLGAVITENDIPLPTDDGFTSNQNINAEAPNTTNLYVYLDLTTYYLKLYKLKTNLQNSKVDMMTTINEKINNMVIKNLGMKPTIYNIFKLICDDVDTFFNTLWSTSNEAEKAGGHHEKYKSQIIGSNYVDVPDKIYAFPMFIRQEKVCNQLKQTRYAPIDLSNNVLPEPFPELVLVQKFIDTFTKQQKITEQFNMRSEQNADGSFKWIPLSPMDSKIASSTTLTPYFGVDNSNGGSASQPIDFSKDPKLSQVFKKLVERFYILSQNALADGFYITDEKKSKGEKALVKMHARAEAINLAVSITNTEYTNLLANAAQLYSNKNNINGFYKYLSTYDSDIYSFNESDREFFTISGGDDAYTNKYNENFIGCKITSEPIVLLNTDNLDGSGPVEKFQKEIQNTGFFGFLKSKDLYTYYKFTNENLFYIKDGSEDGISVGSENVDVATRFISTSDNIQTDENGNVKFYNLMSWSAVGNPQNALMMSIFGGDKTDSIPKKKFIDIIVGNSSDIDNFKAGNAAFPLHGAVPVPQTAKLNAMGNMVENWADQLSKYDNEIYENIINYGGTSFNPRLSALILLSNFGYTLSPFNYYPFNLTNELFSIPGIVEVPRFVPQYMGCLVGANPGTDFYNDIYEFFVNGAGKNLDSSGLLVFADLIDINNYLSPYDTIQFQNQFVNFYGGNGQYNTGGMTGTIYYGIISQLKTLYELVNQDNTLSVKAKRKLYQENLQEGGRYFQTITQVLISRLSIANFSQLTFNPKAKEKTNVGYISLDKTNADSIKKGVNDNFFTELFQELSTRIKDRENTLINKDQETKKLTGDEDIITQTYYSFKNINDKWLAGPKFNNKNPKYPTFDADMSDTLINSFAFVDRAMNPIGDTIINPEMLVQLLEDQNVSVFSVLTQLLSVNGFEFFPLQNFMTFSETNKWQDSFKIDPDGLVSQRPTFVCMYIGGASSYPTGIQQYMGGKFVDDGVVDITGPGLPDFSNQNCETVPTDDDQLATNPNFPYKQVRAFRVRFGEQAQSMFTDIKIDSKEYPETNESIQILSRLAGDNKLQAPTPKGQNLFNLYENRAYRATVSGIGNAMIQPTQYFQVENVPMYNGAYLITSVEHTIELNKMTTSFTGTKILKYPIPRVLNASALAGFDGGNTDNTNSATASTNSITEGVGSASNPIQAQYNSMYIFKIQ